MDQDLSKKEKLEQVSHWGIRQQVDQTVDAVKPPWEKKQGNTNIHLDKLTGQGLKSASKAWKELRRQETGSSIHRTLFKAANILSINHLICPTCL